MNRVVRFDPSAGIPFNSLDGGNCHWVIRPFLLVSTSYPEDFFVTDAGEFEVGPFGADPSGVVLH